MIRLSPKRSALPATLAVVAMLAAVACASPRTSVSPDTAGPSAAIATDRASVDPGQLPASSDAGGGGSTPATVQPATTGVPAAGRKLAGLTSFRFSLTVDGSGFDDLVQGLGAIVGAPVVVEGTVVERPTKAVSISTEGMQIVTIGDKAWMNQDTGWIDVDPASLGDVGDAFNPGGLYATVLAGTRPQDWTLVGDETKNGVACVHYRAQGAALATLGDNVGADAGTTTADVWLAKNGEYPVRAAIVGNSGGDPAEFVLDITHVDDATNAVKPPA